MAYRFGVTGGLFSDLATLGLIMGLVLAVLFSVQVIVSGAADYGWGMALMVGCALVALPVMICLLVGVCLAAFSVHVSTKTVKHTLFDRLEISEYPVAEFVDVMEERCALIFANRRRMHLVGMHKAELLRLAECIREQQAVAPPNKSLELDRKG